MSQSNFVRAYFEQLGFLLRHPVLFFRQLPAQGGLAQPIAFALVTHWIGTSIEFFWQSWMGSLFFRNFRDLLEDSPQMSELEALGRSQIWDWLFGMGSVLADPFLTLLSLVLSALLVFVAVRILVSPQETRSPYDITYESCVRILSYSLAPSIFFAIPVLGSVIGSLLIFVYTVIGVKEVYQVDTGRSILIALFPKLLFFGMILTGLLVFAFSIFKFLLFFSS